MTIVKLLNIFEMKKHNFIYLLLIIDIILISIDMIFYITYLNTKNLQTFFMIEMIADSIMILSVLTILIIFCITKKMGISLKFYSHVRIFFYLATIFISLLCFCFLFYYDTYENFELFFDNKILSTCICVFLVIFSIFNVFWSIAFKNIVFAEDDIEDDNKVALDLTEEKVDEAKQKVNENEEKV